MSTKAKQFGYELKFADGLKFTCLGDEPYNEHARQYAEKADWLLAEAFCQYKDRDIFKPYEKNHSTVKEASELAEELAVKNLVLYHTEDKHIDTRKADYTAEAQEYYHGNIFVPDDLDVIEL
jgi:ribonuclease Z